MLIYLRISDLYICIQDSRNRNLYLFDRFLMVNQGFYQEIVKLTLTVNFILNPVDFPIGKKHIFLLLQCYIYTYN